MHSRAQKALAETILTVDEVTLVSHADHKSLDAYFYLD